MRCAHKLLLTSAAGVAIGLVSAQARADLALTYEKLFLEGETAPGLTQAFSGFDAPVVNAAGQIAFYGLFDDGGTEAGLWANSSGNFELAVRTGVNAPGTTENLFTFVGLVNNRVGIGGGGNIMFQGAMDTAPSSTDRGIWYGAPTSLSLLAREGDTAPDSGSPYTGNLGTFSIGPSGIPAFASPVGINPARSMFIRPAATLESLYIAGDQVPGEAAGIFYGAAVSGPPPQVNSAGQSAFGGTLTGGATGAAIFVGPEADARVLAAVGREAPDVGLGVNFDSLGRPDLNDNAEVVFAAGLSSFGNATASVGDAIYYGSLSGGISPAAKFGDLVAGNPDLAYETFPTAFGPTTNDVGQIAFIATISGTGVVSSTDTVIMAGQAGDPFDLFMIGREGLDFPADFSLLAGPLINNQGLIAFGMTHGTESSLWLGDLDGNLVEVISTLDNGSKVGLSSDLEIVSLTLAGTTDGFRFLSDEGTLTFRLTFDDTSEGIFKVTTVIPEPAAGALLGLGVLALLARRRRV